MKLLSFLLAGTFALLCYTGLSQTLPAGFTTTTIGSGWNLPLGTAFTNDGQKMFVWEKDGRVYVCNRNASGAYIKQTTPVLDISEEVANWGDHGLMGFALDPNYLNNGLIYLLYVVDRHYLMNFGTPSYNPSTSSTGATIGRITRYKTTTSGSNTVIDLSSRFILLGETRQTGICIMHDSHGLGTLAFAADGTLLATAGDGGSYYVVDKGSDTDTDFQQALADGIIRPAENVGAFRAQMLNSHNGKLLRIDPVTGNGVSSNPYFTAAQPRSPKSRVWAFGLRNPFRFSIKAGTGSTNPAAGDVGEIFVGDVGWNTYEEVTVISTPGVNGGWPLFEGLTATPGYTSAVTANLDEPNPLFGIGGCTQQYFNFQDLIKQVTADNNKTVFNPCNPATPIGTGNRYVHHRPSIDWRHFTNEARVGVFSGNTATTAMIGSPESNVIGTPFPGNCALGGPWYTGTNFPAAYQNKYFVGDHDGKWIRCFSVDFTDVVTEVKNFGTGFQGTVNINMNPLDGTLVVVELGDFAAIGPSIKQIRFGGNQSPVVRMTSDKTFGPSVLNVNFTGNTSADPDGTIAGYSWNFGDGGTSTTANPSHNFTEPANTPTKYVVRLTVTDNLGASSVDSIIISVNNTPPVVNITSPVKNSLYKIGPDTMYTCSATVTDAQHSGAQLKYEWQTFLRHNSHQHPEPISNAISPTTHISRIGCTGDDYYWLIKLTVTDAAGLSATDSSKIFPDCSPGVDNIPPTVSSVTPVNGATNITTATTVSAILNETIDPVTVTGTTFQLKDAANNVVPASITTSFNQITLTPSAALAGSTVYTATIKSGASGVKDLAGNALVNDYSWAFTTIEVDLTPPTITSVLPANGATAVSTGSTLTANFNEAIDGTTVNGTTFQLRDAGNNLVPAIISTVAGQLTLTPSAPLTGLISYTATITGGSSGIKDLAGNALASDYAWSFTTDAVDDIPPTVTSVMPASAALGVGVSAAVSANLSEAINASTVTTATFQLKDDQNNLIAATVSSLSGVLTLIPASALATSTTYTATIVGGASGVKDLAGNALAGNYNWSFTTVGGTIAPPVTIQSFDAKSLIGSTTHSFTAVPAGALLVISTTADAFVSDCSVSSIPALTWTKRVDAGAPSSDNAEIWTAVFAAGGAIAITSDWGEEFSQASVCYVVLNAEPNLNGAFGTAVLQPAPSVAVTTARENSIIFGCTADWKAINGATRTLRDAATERLYFRDGHFTTYHYNKTAPTTGVYTLGVSLPAGQQSSTSLLEIRSDVSAASIPPTVTTHPSSQNVCPGANVSFTSAASGDTPTVQWQSSIDGTIWSDINGAVNAVLTFAATTSDNSKKYRAVWTNSGGPASSNPATLTVNTISAPVISVTNNCGSSELTAVSFGGSLLWSNGATTPSITVITAGTYTVTQTVNGCISAPGSAEAAPKAIPFEPSVSVVNNCGNSVLTASGFSGSLLWSTGETTGSITVTTAGTYTVTQTVDGCTGTFGSGAASPLNSAGDPPLVTVVNNCGHSVLTASGYTGSLLWSTGETAESITVTTAGTYTVTQTINGCTSPAGTGTAFPIPLPPTPIVSVVNNCENSVLTASGFTGSLLWSTGETSATINVTAGGIYTVTQTIDGCVSDAGSGIASPNAIPSAPGVIVIDNCGNSVLTASGYAGSLLWSTGETTESITVTTTGTYTVNQTVNGCTSTEGSGVAAPKTIPVAPTVTVVDNCGNSVLTATAFSGSLLWSTGETTESIAVTAAGTYTATQTVNGCASPEGSGSAVPNVPSAPIVSVVDNCESSVLTASGVTGTLLWNTGETTASIIVTTAGTYTVTQTINGCTSVEGSGNAAPNTIPVAPVVTVVDNCGNSVLTASGFTGSLLWSTDETTASITVNNAGTYTVTQTINGCTGPEGSGIAVPKAVPSSPIVTVIDDCGISLLTAYDFTGSLLWSTGESTASITITTAGTYTVTQTVNGCASPESSAIAAPNVIPSAPIVAVVDNCESSVLTASGLTGALLWSTGETTASITVTTAGTYTVTQTINGCTSAEGSGVAAPKTTPVAPTVTVIDNCGNSVLTASGFTGSLLWSTGETTVSITATIGGTYTVSQSINGCTSPGGSGVAAPQVVPSAPIVTVIDDCTNSIVTAYDFTGSLLWSTGETTASITVTTAGTYTVTQTINGCTSVEASGIAAPKTIPVAPTVTVVDNCGNSVLTASGFTGSLLWSTGETTASITVNNAGTYTVTQTINGCISPTGSGIAAPLNPVADAPVVTVVNNCGNSALTASGYTGTLLWSTGETTESITVIANGTYTVTQIINGCTSPEGIGVAAPHIIPSAPIVSVVDNCESSVLTASGITGSLLWSTGETTASITVITAGTYTVTQTISGCTSVGGNGIAAPKAIPVAPVVTVVDNCGNSVLTASGITGALLWSNGASTPSITVTTAGTYSVTQSVDGCTGPAGTGSASPKPIPVLSGNLTATSVSGTAFSYTAGSTTAGTNFAWSRAAVTGVSNTAANGTGNINETLINTLSTAVNVTYVYALTANGCTNTQNVVVSVSSVPVVTSVSPANGAAGVSISPTITANFSEVLNGSTVTATTFELRDAGNNIVPAVISTSINTITLSPTAALANSTTYTVTIKGGASGVKGLVGNALVNDYTWSFTTVASQPPLTIQSSNSQTGTVATVHPLTGVPAGALLVLTTTADAVVSNCIVSSSPSLTWTKRVDAGAASSDNAEIWTAVYAAGGSITVTSNWGTDNSQASVCHVVLNAEPTLSGAFGMAVLQPAPSVTVTTSRENSIIFGCTADWKAVNGATRTLRDAATERLYFRDGNYTTYHYTKAATSIAAYTEGVSLPAGQQASTALLEIRSAIVTVDITPPTVTSVTPVNGTTGIAVNSTASAVFNEAMNAATINNSTIELRNSSNTLIAATVSYNAVTRTVTLTPSAPLANSTVYTVTIIGGASGVKDAAGNALVNNFNWSFTTEVADIIPPTVTVVSPLNGATGVTTGANMIANFSEAVNASTVTTATFQLRDAGNNLIPASVSTSSGQVTLDPTSVLTASTIYTATITGGASGVKDLAGNALASNFSWSFTTADVTSQPVTIQSVNTKTGTAATVHPLTAVPAGALLVLATTADAVVSDCSVSSSPALIWTKRVDAGAVNSDNAEIWTAVYAAGGSIAVTSNWGFDNSQSSVCYVVLNAEPTLAGAFGTAVLQPAPSVTVTTTRENSIIFGCTADWKAINGATRTLRDAATDRLYFKDGNYTTYHYTKAATSIGSYTEGISFPAGQQASTALLEIRSAGSVATRPVSAPITGTTNSNPDVNAHSLGQNYPNPFEKGTNIPFTLGRAEKVNLTLFDVSGRTVKVLVNASKDAGKHIVSLNAGSLSKGVYFYRIQAGDFTDVKKLIIW